MFGTLISRFWDHVPQPEGFLRVRGEAALFDLVAELRRRGDVGELAALDVDLAFARLFPGLRDIPGSSNRG
jgi:hypothetical protein